MLSRPRALILLAAACVVGTAVGAYVALHESAAASRDAALVDASATSAAAASGPSVGAVTETEATVSPATPGESATQRVEAPSAAAPARPRRETSTVQGVSTSRASTRSPENNGQPTAPATAEKPVLSEPPALEKPWPSRDWPTPTPEPQTTSASASQPEPSSPEPAVPEPPPAPVIEELVVPADAVMGLQIETAITSERARVEDRVEARVTRDVKVADRIAIPAGTRVQGSVVEVTRGGKVKERARLGVRFHTLVLANSTSVPIRTETVFREGASPAPESAAKIGGAAVGGAILGAILGGTKGAVIGGSAGAAGGTAAVMAGDRNAAVLTTGSTVTVRLSEPATIQVERQE